MVSKKAALLSVMLVTYLLLLLLLLDQYENRTLQNVPQLNVRLPLFCHTSRLGTNSPKGNLIHTNEEYLWQFNLHGSCFNEKGTTVEIISSLTSSMVHNFSLDVAQEAERRFIDPTHSHVYHVMSPAFIWRHGKIVFVSRIWLELERFRINKAKEPANHFEDSWLFTQEYDTKLQPMSNGSIIGIPMPVHYQYEYSGPADPRVFSVKNKLFINFNGEITDENGNLIDWTILWDYDVNIPVIPRIKGGSPMHNASKKNGIIREKNWAALVQNDELYFVHSLDPLRVMHCSLDGDCEFVHSETDDNGFVFDQSLTHLRGGTPYELYQWPYYVSVAHSTLYKENTHHVVYTSHIVVLCVRPYRIVYVSSNIEIHKEVYQQVPLVRKHKIDDGYIFPSGLIIENKDTMTIGVHVNDHTSLAIRLKGLEALMTKIISQDIKNSIQKGPPVGYIQNFIKNTVQNYTHDKYVGAPNVVKPW